MTGHTEEIKTRAAAGLQKAKSARAAWLADAIDGETLLRILRECNYRDQIKAGIHEEFDEVSQVNCAREWLEASTIAGDDVATVRRYVMASWTHLSRKNGEWNDPYGVLSPTLP